ncbi:M20 family metallopeptidase [soil metagenome]|nr:M20 family metallopeptidase [Deinococcota bacterium]
MSQAIREAAGAQKDAYLKTLRGLVELETPTGDLAAAARLVSVLEARLAGDGWGVERHPQEAVGDHLVARFEAPGAERTLILAHYDTVWPVGTIKGMPFRVAGEAAYGPGTLDMKAGITTALHAVALARDLGLALRGLVTLLVSSDEETGSASSRALIEDLSKEHERVFVVEPGRDDGALKVGRKGTGGFEVLFEGVSAHAGNNPGEGASALRELALFLLYAEALGDEAAGTTVNLTVARGGSVTNVIAERATAKIDLRVLRADEGERVAAALAGYQAQDGRVRVRVGGGLNRPPLEFTPANRALFDEAVACGERLGLQVSGGVVGGGSDGNFSSALGVATLDGLGAVGSGPHARHEHIRIADTLDRLALMVCLLTV